MVDFSNKPKRTTFSLKPGERAPSIRQREVLRMAVLIGVTVLFVVILLDFLMKDPAPESAQELAAPVVALEREEAAPMDLVSAESLPAWPSSEAVAAKADEGQYLIENPSEVSLYIKPYDARTMAWLHQRLPADQESPPLPLAYSGDDVVLGRVKHGKALMIGGTITNMVVAEHAQFGEWVRLQLLLPKVDEITLVAMVEAPRSAFTDEVWEGLAPGVKVHTVGRYLGTAELDTVTDAKQKTPVVAAYSVRRQDDASLLELLQLGQREERGRVWRYDANIFTAVDDYYDANPRMSHLERRPYYYLLGQVRLDLSTPGAYAQARHINQWSKEVYQTPVQFRGDPFIVEGTVIEAWEDEQASLDKPFGVNRVVRMWMWDTVFGIGAEPFRNLFEVAILLPDVTTPLPKTGDFVRLKGRFLKVLTYYSPSNPYMTMVDPNHDANEYTLFKFFVAPGFEIVPPAPPPKHFWFKVTSLVVMGSFLAFMVVMMILEGRQADHYKDGLRRLRSSRRRLVKEKRDAGASEEQSSDHGTASETKVSISEGAKEGGVAEKDDGPDESSGPESDVADADDDEPKS